MHRGQCVNPSGWKFAYSPLDPKVCDFVMFDAFKVDKYGILGAFLILVKVMFVA